jgi:hypothetical protein
VKLAQEAVQTTVAYPRDSRLRGSLELQLLFHRIQGSSWNSMILIVSAKDDIHALAIRETIRNRGYTECHILECDRIAQRECLSMHLGRAPSTGHISLGSLGRISISDAKVIWNRRHRGKQVLDATVKDPDTIELIDNECRGAFSSLLATTFRGKWVSAPDPTFRASDKLFQLAIAHSCGFRVPETIVTQSRNDVVDLFLRHAGKIIVKNILGMQGAFLLTRFLENPLELPAEAFEVCPAIYQEYIPGTRHIRLNCFGPQSFAATIETEELDWRANLNKPIKSWKVSAELQVRVRTVLDALGLEMGIVDLKETPDGEIVWFEVNPQGQFLFLDAVTDLALNEKFSDFLVATSNAAV